MSAPSFILTLQRPTHRHRRSITRFPRERKLSIPKPSFSSIRRPPFLPAHCIQDGGRDFRRSRDRAGVRAVAARSDGVALPVPPPARVLIACRNRPCLTSAESAGKRQPADRRDRRLSILRPRRLSVYGRPRITGSPIAAEGNEAQNKDPGPLRGARRPLGSRATCIG